MDRFQELLWDLGELIEVPLHADKNNACKLILDQKLTLQLEMDQYDQKLLITSFISELPPGKFREDILKNALKVNGMRHSFGVFSYIESNNFLILHQYFHVDNLSREKLAEYLESLIQEAEEWRSAISNGHSSPNKYEHPL